MGNSPSSQSNNSDNSNKEFNKEFNNFYQIIDYISTYYILTMNFKSLEKLSEKDYCDKLVILTSDIIKDHFTEKQITYLAQRVQNGEIVDKMEKSDVIFVNKDILDELDVSNDTQKSIKKKRECIAIAKFYVKIAHVFAAIVMTINPVYSYKVDGNDVKTGLLNKDKIPQNATNRKLHKINICDNRIRALNRDEIYDDKTESVSLNPKICDVNIDKMGNVKNLHDEPGIPELSQLYFDDYDYSNSSFKGMSEISKKQYLQDLNTFFSAFTGNEVMPPEITKFSDIKLKNYMNMNECNSGLFKNKITISKNDKLFIKYAENIKNMIQTAANNQQKLLYVINSLFTFVDDPYTHKKKVRVNPQLTDDSLQKLIEQTRKLIVNLYVNCELQYVNGIKIYEAIVESKILETTDKQIQNLTEKKKKILEEMNEIKNVI